jgi:hypothetical protein
MYYRIIRNRWTRYQTSCDTSRSSNGLVPAGRQPLTRDRTQARERIRDTEEYDYQHADWQVAKHCSIQSGIFSTAWSVQEYDAYVSFSVLCMLAFGRASATRGCSHRPHFLRQVGDSQISVYYFCQQGTAKYNVLIK